jgi:hypothetical protein
MHAGKTEKPRNRRLKRSVLKVTKNEGTSARRVVDVRALAVRTKSGDVNEERQEWWIEWNQDRG